MSALLFKYFFPKLDNEGKIMIKNYGCKHATQFKNLVDENLNDHGRDEGVLQSTEVSVLGE